MDHSSHSSHSSQPSQPSQSSQPSGVNPCTDHLTDQDYLEHMIPHHQVAIDMSEMLKPNTINPIMLHLCRDIIRKQSYEIWEMTIMKQKLSDGFFHPKKENHTYPITKLEFHNPTESKSKDGSCNPLFFKPNDHMHHMAGMKVNDKSYLEHMIPHHQVAVDMSKRLLMHTNNSYLIDFCRRLIQDQQGEIFYMNSLLKNSYNYQSELLR